MLAEILLVLVTVRQAHAEPGGAIVPAQPAGSREIRLVDFRQFLVRSLTNSSPQRLLSATRGRTLPSPRGGARDQRLMQSLLLRPAVDYPGRFVNAKAEMLAPGQLAGPGPQPRAALPARAGLTAGSTLSIAPVSAQPPQGRITPPRPADAALPVAAAVPVLRNPDVQPDRNLDRLSPAAAQAPAAETYDQAGIVAGNFLLKPAVEIWGGYATNPGRQPKAVGSPVVIAAPELSVRSQFDRHQLNADMRFAYTDTTAQQTLSHPTAEARVNGRLDVTERTKLVAEGRFLNDALVTPGFQQQPRATTYGTTAGIVQGLGDAEIAVKGSYDRITFANGVLGTNQILNTQDRNYTQPGAQVRVSYAISPELSPFVDVSYDRRNHDMLVDFNGMRRDSTGIAGRAGVALNMGSVTGDVSAGYLSRRFDAPNMRNVEGWIADATIAWAADPTTTFVLVARSQASETPAANIFGILSRDVILQVDHQFEPWLVGTLRSGYGQDRFVGNDRIDDRFFVAGGGVYKLSRFLHLKSDVRAEWTRSNIPMNNILAITGLVGMRVQY